MPIKIIKRGITKADKYFRGGCTNCGTEIECRGIDLCRENSNDQRESSYDYVSCPVCQHKIVNLKEFTPRPQEINDPREYGYSGERR